MEYIFLAIGVIVYVAAWVFCFSLLVDSDPLDIHWWAGVAMAVGLLAFTFWTIFNVEESSPPCAQYETQMMFNAATKTMMPAQFCVKEGTWVNQ